MPNTLCHIALQTPVTGRRLQWLPWVLFGCIIPDLPWILFHFGARAGLEPYTLRFYVTVQASLFFSLLLSAAISLFAKKSRIAFVVIGGNCLLHLLLDSLEDKWGNGVNLLAPFDWQLFSLHLIAPDTSMTAVVTTCGLVMLLLLWPKSLAAVKRQGALVELQKKKATAGLVLAGLYLTTPPLFFTAVDRADTWQLRTMRLSRERPGKAFDYDRGHFDAITGQLQLFSGERLHLEATAESGPLPQHSGRLSIKGVFTGSDSVRLTSIHLLRSHRDRASLCGLVAVCIFLFQSLFLPRLKPLWQRQKKRFDQPSPPGGEHNARLFPYSAPCHPSRPPAADTAVVHPGTRKKRRDDNPHAATGRSRPGRQRGDADEN